LRRIGASEEEYGGNLEHAFAELEALPGFPVFRQRQLEEKAARPTFRELAVELGVSHTRVGQLEKSFKARIASQMKEEDWPIRLAAEQLRETLGAVARSDELDGAFADLDPGDTLDPSQGHRRALLLWLCEYRTDKEWILGPGYSAASATESPTTRSSPMSDLDIKAELSRWSRKHISGDEVSGIPACSALSLNRGTANCRSADRGATHRERAPNGRAPRLPP
jgi:hypothetical protein